MGAPGELVDPQKLRLLRLLPRFPRVRVFTIGKSKKARHPPSPSRRQGFQPRQLKSAIAALAIPQDRSATAENANPTPAIYYFTPAPFPTNRLTNPSLTRLRLAVFEQPIFAASAKSRRSSPVSNPDGRDNQVSGLSLPEGKTDPPHSAQAPPYWGKYVFVDIIATPSAHQETPKAVAACFSTGIPRVHDFPKGMPFHDLEAPALHPDVDPSPSQNFSPQLP